MTVTSVQPYWQLTFDADGDPDAAERDRLVAQVADRHITDLVVFSHGWNSDMSGAEALYDSFFAPFPGLLSAAGPDVRFGYAGVIWPSMRFSDEPIPNFPHVMAAVEASAPGGLDARERAALAQVFPGSGPVVGRLAELLTERPADEACLTEFAALVRTLTGVAPDAAAARFAQDTGDAPPEAEPAMLGGDVAAVCAAFADALTDAGVDLGPDEPAAETLFGGLGKKIWDGAKELLRQATYYAMKRRAGTVGQLGLGPALGRLAQASASTRIHLVGHSFGARLVSFSLRGLPAIAHNVASVTLLQGAFSHYAFCGPLPFDSKGGALNGLHHRVNGPVVACHSSHDQALGVFYPLASRLAGDDESLLGLGDRWGALGHDGFQSLDNCRTLTLPQALALATPFPTPGCVSVDVSTVVCNGGPPSGAHSDICHPELAQVVLRAADRA